MRLLFMHRKKKTEKRKTWTQDSVESKRHYINRNFTTSLLLRQRGIQILIHHPTHPNKINNWHIAS